MNLKNTHLPVHVSKQMLFLHFSPTLRQSISSPSLKPLNTKEFNRHQFKSTSGSKRTRAIIYIWWTAPNYAISPTTIDRLTQMIYIKSDDLTDRTIAGSNGRLPPGALLPDRHHVATLTRPSLHSESTLRFRLKTVTVFKTSTFEFKWVSLNNNRICLGDTRDF